MGIPFVRPAPWPGNTLASSLCMSITNGSSSTSSNPSHSGLSAITTVHPAFDIFFTARPMREYERSSAAGTSSTQTVILGDPSDCCTVSREKRTNLCPSSVSSHFLREIVFMPAPILLSCAAMQSRKNVFPTPASPQTTITFSRELTTLPQAPINSLRVGNAHVLSSE